MNVITDLFYAFIIDQKICKINKNAFFYTLFLNVIIDKVLSRYITFRCNNLQNFTAFDLYFSVLITWAVYERHRVFRGKMKAWRKHRNRSKRSLTKFIFFKYLAFSLICNYKHNNRFKAAVVLPDKASENEEDYKHLLAAFANIKLRNTFFGF